MTAHAIACRVSAIVTRVNSRPLFVLAFPLICGAIVVGGWSVGALQVTLLALTTVLSVDASWVNRLQLLKQATEAGEVEE